MAHMIERVVATVAVLMCPIGQLCAAEPTVLDVDVRSLASKHATNPTLFAHDVSFFASSRSHGEWTNAADRAEWRLAVRVPGARSMSIHADRVTLPSGLELWIGGLRHGSEDVSSSGLWSRPVAGDLLEITAMMPTQVAPNFLFEVQSVQVGFKTVFPAQGTNVPTKASTDSTNFECHRNGANEGVGRATLALFIQNVGFCTGTLVNNTASDRRMFVFTAVHCAQNAPLLAVAPGIRAYFEEKTPCGVELGSAGDGLATTLGAAHRASYDDTWLFELSNPAPANVSPYWAGVDASSPPPAAGMFSVNHSGGRDQQYYSAPVPPYRELHEPSLTDPDPANLWLARRMNPSVTEGGASGSGLFTSSGRFVGTMFGTTGTGGPVNIGDACEPSEEECGVYVDVASGWSVFREYLAPGSNSSIINSAGPGGGGGGGSVSGGALFLCFLLLTVAARWKLVR